MGVASAAQRQPEERREEIAARWYAAIAGTGYSVKSAHEVRQELRVLAGKAIDFMDTAPSDAAPLDATQAEEIGAALSRLHYVQPEALHGTLQVLGEELPLGGPDGGTARYVPRLTALLRGIATGFARGVCSTVLAEQETIRAALVSEIERSHAALLVAHSELEQRVKDRTAELARANEELRSEVTERQRIEGALRESEEKFRRLVEEMAEVVYVADQKGELTYVSPSVEGLLGYKPEEIIGHHFTEFVYPGDLPRIQEGLKNLLAGHSQIEEYRFVAKSGDVRCGRTSSTPVLEDSRLVGFQGLLTDITESRRAKAALEASEERWRLLVDNAPELVVTVDRAGTISYLNRGPFGDGLRPGHVVGTDWRTYLVPEYADTVAQAVRRVFETGEAGYVEIPVINRFGQRAWYGTYLGPLRQEGRVVEVMLVARDVTEQKQIAEMKDNLIRDVSHELRTPLAKVQMSLELLVELLESEELDRERAIRVSGFATRSAARMVETVENILDLSRLDAGTWLGERRLIRPQELIEEAIVYAVPLSAAKDLRLAADLPASLPVVRGDWNKLYRVFQNLLYNAIKFSDGGEIVVVAEGRGDELVIGVRDQGHGILPENLGRIFERFFQEQTRQPGAGLGLPICKAIVEEHGGRIWAESAGPGQGATFWFTLPAETGEGEEG